jgi:hypothetical protein
MGAEAAVAAAYGVGAASSIAGGWAQSESYKAQGEYQGRMAELNARALEFEAAEAVRKGDSDANVVRRRANQILGKQRAGLAASGVDINTGTAAVVQQETEFMSEIDQMTVKNNAWREAFGLKSQASSVRQKGEMDRMLAEQSARTSLVSGGLNAIQYGLKSYGSYNNPKYKDHGDFGSNS